MLRRLLFSMLCFAPLTLSAQVQPTPAPEQAASLVTAAAATSAVSTSTASASSATQQADGTAAEPELMKDFITPHITDASYLELPYWKPPFHTYVNLPAGPTVTIAGITFDFSLSKHVVMMLIAAIAVAIMLIVAANASRRDHAKEGRSKGFGGAMEALALYLRNEVVLPNVGPHGEKYVPFTLTLFFFILFMNLLGMIPFGATATGNISVTATLAIITFIMVEAAGIRAQGAGYLNTMFYWNNDLPVVMRPLMFLIMSPVEMLGKLTKPFALAIRLFANMTAGHIVLLALIGLVFSFQSWLLAPAPLLMALAIAVLEVFVAFLQAFIFTLLASVFIGQVREAHH